MDFNEKAKIRMAHWLKHNQSHLKEYDSFAQDLENNGKSQSAAEIQQMIELMKVADEHLKNALQYLK